MGPMQGIVSFSLDQSDVRRNQPFPTKSGSSWNATTGRNVSQEFLALSILRGSSMNPYNVSKHRIVSAGVCYGFCLLTQAVVG